MTMRVGIIGVGHPALGLSTLRAMIKDVAARQDMEILAAKKDRVVLVNAKGLPIGEVKVPPAPTTETVKYWNCKNCGHLAEQSAQLKELSFKWLGPLTSKTTCPNCGSYTLQQAYDETFKAGYFVVVKAYNGIRGKGRA